MLKIESSKLEDYEAAIKGLIGRVIDNVHDINDFVIHIDQNLNKNKLDTFEVITIFKEIHF